MRVMAAQALSLATALLEARGAEPSHARLQAEVLVEAELRGHPSHGLQRLPRLLARIDRGLIAPNATGSQTWAGSAFLAVDGEAGLGPVVAHAAIEQLVDRVEQTGIAIAGIRDANHLGMLAVYVQSIACRGLIGIVLTSSEALVHPHGGDKAMMGTNPVAIGMPTSGEPYILDMATSVVSMGKIHDYALKGEPISQGWALGPDGAPTLDAQRAKSGSIAPFGGAKGYGLGLGFELLVAGIAGTPLLPMFAARSMPIIARTRATSSSSSSPAAQELERLCRGISTWCATANRTVALSQFPATVRGSAGNTR